MNLEQLNGSGQHFSIFVATALVALAITGGSWFLIEQVNSYLNWQKGLPDDQCNGKTRYSLAVRLALLFHLVMDGQTGWMFPWGAWWRILLNDRSKLVSLDDAREDRGTLTAGEYVSKCSFCPLLRHDRFYAPFRLGGLYWISAGDAEGLARIKPP